MLRSKTLIAIALVALVFVVVYLQQDGEESLPSVESDPTLPSAVPAAVSEKKSEAERSSMGSGISAVVRPPVTGSSEQSGALVTDPAKLPPEFQQQLNSPPPPLPPDLKAQLEGPPPELPADLKAQLEAPVPEIPEDIRKALATPPREVSLEEVNGPNSTSDTPQ